MAIPDFEQTMLPLLRCIENGKDWKMSEIEDWSVKHFELNEAERTELKPTSDHETLFHNRLHWAKLYLKRADLVMDLDRGLVKITKEGLSALKQKPKKIDIKFLKQYPKFLEWYTKKKTKETPESDKVTMTDYYQLDEENAKKIDAYIQKHPECKLNKTHAIILQGVRIDLPVYRLPLNLLFYNIRNGRFAAEYIDLKKREGRELRTEDPADAKKIQKLLIELDQKQSLLLELDLKKVRQKEPGVITIGGYVINGNRRMAVLQNLVEQGDSDFNYLEAARLPRSVSSTDIWKIEAGIQLSRRVQLDYGPINNLLKFEQGIEAGLKPTEIAKSLYGGFTEKEILQNLEQLKLISEYLNFIGYSKQFNKAKGVHEHFIDLRNIINKEKQQGASPDDIVSIKKIAFQLIFDGVPQRELRKIKDILTNAKIKENFWDAEDHSKPEEAGKKAARKQKANEDDAFTAARTIFNNCLDSVKAESEAQQPVKLLKRALTNLEAIAEDEPSLKDSESTSLIGYIDEVVRRLKNLTKS